jgi:pimeloyl-ACP methyl ester carboxylesterase
MRRMIGDERWERLPPATRSARRAEGGALVAGLTTMRSLEVAPYDLGAFEAALVCGVGSESSAHHRRAVFELHGQVEGSTLIEIGGAGHGAHHTHPDAFASFLVQTHRAVSAERGPSR